MLYIIILLVIILDQYTKALAVAKLADNSVPIILNVFHLTYVENTGAAFGIMQNGNLFFKFSSLIIIAIIVFMLFKYKPKEKVILISAGLVLGGAIGNLADRFFRGFVVDFFDFRLINYPVFNIADSAVVVGAILFAVYIIFKKDDGIAKA